MAQSKNLNKKIIIVGAGMSGIVTAKFLLLDGFTDVTLLESYSYPGGVWATGRAYPRLSSNSIRGNYSLSDDNLYRSDEEWKALSQNKSKYWVYGEEIREGVERYTKKWGVMERIKFNTTVDEISEVPGTEPYVKWNVKYTDNASQKTTHVVADLLLVCTGLFSRPNVPRGIPGQLSTDKNAFKGLQLHSSDVAKDDNVKKLLGCKHVVIVGYGKSSLDLAEWLGLERRERKAAGKELNNIHLVFRQPHWFVPMTFFATLDFMKRGSQAGAWWRPIWKLGDPDPETGAQGKKVTQERSASSVEREKLLGKKVSIEDAIRMGHNLPENHVLVPKHKFAVDSSLGVASEHFFPLALSNDIALHQISSILGIHTDPATNQSYMLTNPKPRDGPIDPNASERIPCDAVIWGTGFHFSYPFIPPALQAKLQIPKDNLDGAPRFFRTMLPLAYREGGTIAFNGMFNSGSCACNIETNAHWISELFLQGGPKAGDEGRGILKIPPVEEMDRQVTAFDNLDKIFATGGGAKEGKVHVFGRYVDFADDALSDMGLRTYRNAATREEDWDKIYLAKSWAGLWAERKAKREELARKLAGKL